MITAVLIVLATTSTAFSQQLPPGYGCGWERLQCRGDKVNIAQCNCGCPGNLVCCDADILEDYNYPIWHGTAPFCNGQCVPSCGSIPDCWAQSACGNGKRCWTGNKVLCAQHKNQENFNMGTIVSLSLLQ